MLFRSGIGAATPVEGETYGEHKLQIALVERSSSEVGWEATSRDTLYESMSSERRKERIDAMVADRKSVVKGKRVDLGGRRITKKKTTTTTIHPLPRPHVLRTWRENTTRRGGEGGGSRDT